VAYTDAAFKAIISHDDVRNAFLSSMIGQKIIVSTMTGSALAPYKTGESTRKFFHKLNIEKLKSFVLKASFNPKEYALVEELIKHLVVIKNDFPDQERGTVLDVVCETEHSLINIEIQVSQQFYWAGSSKLKTYSYLASAFLLS
jgi:hypothetical protein